MGVEVDVMRLCNRVHSAGARGGSAPPQAFSWGIQ